MNECVVYDIVERLLYSGKAQASFLKKNNVIVNTNFIFLLARQYKIKRLYYILSIFFHIVHSVPPFVFRETIVFPAGQCTFALRICKINFTSFTHRHITGPIFTNRLFLSGIDILGPSLIRGNVKSITFICGKLCTVNNYNIGNKNILYNPFAKLGAFPLIAASRHTACIYITTWDNILPQVSIIRAVLTNSQVQQILRNIYLFTYESVNYMTYNGVLYSCKDYYINNEGHIVMFEY